MAVAGARIKNFGADLVFDEPADIVVNTASMTDLAKDPPSTIRVASKT